MISQLVSIHGTSKNDEFDKSLGRALRMVREKHSELLDVAEVLDQSSANPTHKKFITNLRFVVPFYYAVALCYYRLTGTISSTDTQRTAGLKQIVTLAHITYADQGMEALARMGWPLFIAGLETDDSVHRDWILEHFRILQDVGENFRRAYIALEIIVAEAKVSLAPDMLRISYIREDLDKFLI
jgi:hypothetical protein